MSKKFKYEIAFSFLAKDETIAHNLNDLIVDRVSSFIYSKRQEELGGTDGELAFNNVFEQEARIVAVLYRAGWGETSWTRIEETAIRNRAYKEGWEFVIFILLDKKSKVPAYLPKAQLWVDYERWGLNGAAAIIEQRIKDNGGEVREETVQDRVDRLKRLKIAEGKRNEYLRSNAALEDSYKEFQFIFNELKAIKPSLEDSAAKLHFSTEIRPEYLYELSYEGFSLLFRLEDIFNRAADAIRKLKISIFQKEGRKNFDYNEITYFETEFTFDKSLSETIGWSDSQNKFWTSKELIHHWIKKYLDELEKTKIKRQDNSNFFAF
ncbi:MAG: hypothetical protein SFU87_08195 [Chitinophagaceae bacterium]|nr:hypothetical protein [Chitinophagaceae bacterium]